MPAHPRLNQIGREEATRGTETSKYPEEEKSTEIARVAASESATAQTRACVTALGRCCTRRCGARVPGGPASPARIADGKPDGMGRPAMEG